VIRKHLLPDGSDDAADGEEQVDTMGPMGPGSKFRRLPSRFPSAENIAALVAGRCAHRKFQVAYCRFVVVLFIA
jgi:hypothetical protein